jgi:hypothetical protein
MRIKHLIGWYKWYRHSGYPIIESILYSIRYIYGKEVDMKNNLDFRKVTWWESLIWSVFPNRCVLCSKWKLWGKKPHKVCEDYELAR